MVAFRLWLVNLTHGSVFRAKSDNLGFKILKALARGSARSPALNLLAREFAYDQATRCYQVRGLVHVAEDRTGGAARHAPRRAGTGHALLESGVKKSEGARLPCECSSCARLLLTPLLVPLFFLSFCLSVCLSLSLSLFHAD